MPSEDGVPTFTTSQIPKHGHQANHSLDLSGRREAVIRQNLLNKTTGPTASMPAMGGPRAAHAWLCVVNIKASNVELVVMEKKTAEMDSKRTGGARVLPPEASRVCTPPAVPTPPVQLGLVASSMVAVC